MVRRIKAPANRLGCGDVEKKTLKLFEKERENENAIVCSNLVSIGSLHKRVWDNYTRKVPNHSGFINPHWSTGAFEQWTDMYLSM